MSEVKERIRASTIGVKRRVYEYEEWRLRRLWKPINVRMLTKVALDSVFPHANENCETRTTLQNRTKEKIVRKKGLRSTTRMRLDLYIPSG